MCFLLLRRLYNESKSLHASHDASLLKCDDDGYQRENELSQTILIRLQAGAFESLCEHLRARSDLVPNMELMTISGFCRNCLAKVSCQILNTESILVTFKVLSYRPINDFCSGLLLKHVVSQTSPIKLAPFFGTSLMN